MERVALVEPLLECIQAVLLPPGELGPDASCDSLLDLVLGDLGPVVFVVRPELQERCDDHNCGKQDGQESQLALVLYCLQQPANASQQACSLFGEDCIQRGNETHLWGFFRRWLFGR